MALFEAATNGFRKQIGKDTVLPVSSFDQANNCHLYSIVVKRRHRWLIWKDPEYETSEFKLYELVEERNTKKNFDALKVEEISVPVISTDLLFKIKGEIGGKLKKLFPVKLSGYKIVIVNTDFNEVQQKEVHTPELLHLVRQLKLNQDHEFIKFVKKDSTKSLCVVYGEWQTTTKSKATASLSKGMEVEGGLRIGSAVDGRMLIDSKSKVSIEIPKDTPLAYKIYDIIVGKDGSMTLDLQLKRSFTAPYSVVMMESQKGLQALSGEEQKALTVHTLKLCSTPSDVHAMSAMIHHTQNCLSQGENVEDEKLQERFKSIEKENDAKPVLALAGFTFQGDKIVLPKAHSDTQVSMDNLYGALEELSDGALERFAEIGDASAKASFHVLDKLTKGILVTKSDPKAELIFKHSKDGKLARDLLGELGVHTDEEKVNFTEGNMHGIYGAHSALFMLHDVSLDEGFETQ